MHMHAQYTHYRISNLIIKITCSCQLGQSALEPPGYRCVPICYIPPDTERGVCGTELSYAACLWMVSIFVFCIIILHIIIDVLNQW